MVFVFVAYILFGIMFLGECLLDSIPKKFHRFWHPELISALGCLEYSKSLRAFGTSPFGYWIIAAIFIFLWRERLFMEKMYEQKKLKEKYPDKIFKQ